MKTMPYPRASLIYIFFPIRILQNSPACAKGRQDLLPELLHSLGYAEARIPSVALRFLHFLDDAEVFASPRL